MNRVLRTVVCSLTLIAAQAAAASLCRANVWAQDSPPAAENSAETAPAPETAKPAEAAPAPAAENSAETSLTPEAAKPAETAPAPEAANSAEAAPAPEAANSAEAAPAPDATLALERSAREKSPELFEKLTLVRKFSARLPNYWRVAKPTKKQTREIYALQKDYFDEISRLEARIARLESERDARMRAILSADQRQALDAKLAEVEKARAEKQIARDADAEE